LVAAAEGGIGLGVLVVLVAEHAAGVAGVAGVSGVVVCAHVPEKSALSSAIDVSYRVSRLTLTSELPVLTSRIPLVVVSKRILTLTRTKIIRIPSITRVPKKPPRTRSIITTSKKTTTASTTKSTKNSLTRY
jgi:hypothetical protein